MQLAIGILTYNKNEELKSLLDQILEEIEFISELIIVDSEPNNSIDLTKYLDILQKNGIPFKYIKLDKNYGCPKGRNFIIVNNNSEYLLFLDDDSVLIKGTIKKSLEIIGKEKNIGILGLDVISKDKYKKENEVFYEESYLFLGGAVFFSKKMIDEVGLYPDDYWMEAEERDYAFRALDKGWKIVKLKNKGIIHSENRINYKRYIFKVRNDLLTILRRIPLVLVLPLFLRKTLIYFASVCKNKGEYFSAFLIGLIWVIPFFVFSYKRKPIKIETLNKVNKIRKEN